MRQGLPGSQLSVLDVIRRRLFGGVALVVLPAALMLVLVASKYDGLRDFAALDHAQAARHLAAGDGLTTSVIRPLSVAFKADLRHHPDLYNAPVHILAVAAFFKVFGSTARVAVGSSACMWILAVWLTFLVGWHWFGWRAGLVAAFFFGCNVNGVAAAVGAMPYSLYSIVILACVWIAFKKKNVAVPASIESTGQSNPANAQVPAEGRQSELPSDVSVDVTAEATREVRPQPLLSPADTSWRIVLSGAACGLATLTHFPYGALAVVIGWCIVVTHPKKWNTIGLFALGFIGALSPWLIRVWMATGSPFVNLYSFEALAGTGQYPGDSIWRYAIPPEQPALFIFHHPIQAGLKLLNGLQGYRRDSVDVMDPIVLLPFLVSLFDKSFSARWRWGMRAAIAGMILTSVVASMLRPDSALLLAWTPVICILSAGWLCEWLPGYVRRMGNVVSRNARVQERLYARAWAEWWVQAAAYGALLFLLAMPLMQYILIIRPVGDAGAGEQFAQLTKKTPTGATVLTDQPAMIAWHAGRVAVWLPQREQDLATLELTFGPFDASFVTASVTQIPAVQRGDWWYWVEVPTGVYHGLSPIQPAPLRAVLRVRPEIAVQ